MAFRSAAIVLAAGRSSRLAPHNKLLTLMPDQRPLIAHTVSRVLASSVQSIITVTGFQADQVQAALAGLPIDFVYAENFADGMAASLRAGLQTLAADVDAALIILGDMPLVETPLLNALIAAYNPLASHDIVVPVWQDRIGNPRLWGRRYFHKLMSLTGDSGAARLLPDYPERIKKIAAPSDAVLQDFDTQTALDTLSEGAPPATYTGI
jgi:molybdenum cofactor cytidylyltransferase